MQRNNKESFVSSASQIELLQLAYFIAIAENGSFSKAAEQLFVTQPLLSQHVSALEKQLETRLFERKVKTIKLTLFGEYFYSKAKEILKLTTSAIDAVQNASLENEKTIKISIGLDIYLDHSIVSSMIRQINKNSPKIEYEINQGISPDIIYSIRQGVFDIGLSFSHNNIIPDELHNKLLFDDYLELIASRKYKSITKISDFAIQVIKKPLLLPSRDTRMLHIASELCEILGLQKRPLFFNNINDMRLAVESDVGFTFIPKLLLDRGFGDRFTRFPISELQNSHITYYAYWADSFQNSIFISQFNKIKY